MESKKETTDFFITNITNYIGLEYVYIYMKLAKSLGLSVCSRSQNSIFMASDIDDYKITIKLSGPKESMDKFKDMWNKIDKDSIKMELDKCLSVGFYETINGTDDNIKKATGNFF